MCRRETTVKFKRNTSTGTLVCVSLKVLFYFHYFIKAFKRCKCLPLNSQTESTSTRNGFSRLPCWVEDSMKKSLLKFAKALRTGMRIKHCCLFSLFIYPLLKPRKGLGDFLAAAVLQMVDLLASKTTI